MNHLGAPPYDGGDVKASLGELVRILRHLPGWQEAVAKAKAEEEEWARKCRTESTGPLTLRDLAQRLEHFPYAVSPDGSPFSG